MLSRALTLNEVRGRSLSMMTPPPVTLIEGMSHSGSPLPCPGPLLSSSPPLSCPPPPPSFSPSPSTTPLSSVSSITPPSDSPHSSCSSPPPSGISPAPFPPMSSSSFPPPPMAAPPSVCFTPHSFNPPPSAPPPCCPCASLLPRLLAAHRLEVRRLLRGALASLGRRLDSLERRRSSSSSRKRKRRRGTVGTAGSPASSSAPPPPVTSSSSSDSEELPPHPPLRRSRHRRRRIHQEEEEEDVKMEERRRTHRGAVREEDEEEAEEDERFVGRMAVSFRGRSGGAAEEEVPLTLHNLTKRRRRKAEAGGSQSGKTTIVAKNGFSKPIRFSSQDALHFLQSVQTGWTFGQSEAFAVSSGQWHFPDLTRPLSVGSNRSSLSVWLSRPPTFRTAPMLRLSEGAVDSLLESVRGGVYCSPQRRLTDRTAPPSLGSDHCYIRLANQSPALSARRHQKQRANHSTRSPHLRRHTLPSCLPNGLSAALPSVQSAASTKLLSTNLERGKRVSQIRIRRASPRETPLTPMGLPKVKRLKKKDFSLEEIYTNKNYKSPTTNRSLETIFEEPREKDGALFVIGQQKKRRLLLFPDFTQPRKRKKLQGAGLSVGLVNRKRARRHMHGCDDEDLDVMLVERLSALEDFLSRQGLDL